MAHMYVPTMYGIRAMKTHRGLSLAENMMDMKLVVFPSFLLRPSVSVEFTRCNWGSPFVSDNPNCKYPVEARAGGIVEVHCGRRFIRSAARDIDTTRHSRLINGTIGR